MSTKLERIVKQLEEGTYKVSSEKIAEKLLKKNPKLSDEVDMKTQIIGNMKGFSVSDYADEGFKALLAFEFKYNGVGYGKYLMGIYEDGTAIELECLGDHFMAFDDDGLMEEAFENDLTDEMVELGLV